MAYSFVLLHILKEVHFASQYGVLLCLSLHDFYYASLLPDASTPIFLSF